MKSLSKNVYAILVFNTLLIGLLSSIFVNKSHTLYPWHSVGMFTFNALLVVAIVISSYQVGKSLFDTRSNQILSFGFFITSTGFILLSVSIVGYFAIIKEFNTPSFLINFLTFVTAFVITPILTARPNKFVSNLFKTRGDDLIKDRSAQTEIERLRESYKPKNIKILFVGESAPASGAFFYDGKPHIFTTNIRKTFEMALDINIKDNKEFVKYFKDKQCYLDDLCLIPINNLSPADRVVMLQKSVEPFSKRLKDINPDVIIILMLGIQTYVHNAVVLSGVRPKVEAVHFPASRYVIQFREKLIPILKKYIKND